jgi:FMN phosphatase YigB (HAD superfamily)
VHERAGRLQLMRRSLGGHKLSASYGGLLLRAAVFDLDHTLFDPGTLPQALFSELEARVRDAAADLVPSAVLDAALADAWRLPFDRVLAHHRLPEALCSAWRDDASALEVTTPLRPYADVVAGLEQLSLQRFLLTTGFRRLQESKVRQLGLSQLFVAVYVDALDPPGPLGKQALLQRLMLEHELRASELVVIGDRADDELAAAQALGMVAVQVLRPGVIANPGIAWRISDFGALPALLARLTGAGAA